MRSLGVPASRFWNQSWRKVYPWSSFCLDTSLLTDAIGLIEALQQYLDWRYTEQGAVHWSVRLRCCSFFQNKTSRAATSAQLSDRSKAWDLYTVSRGSWKSRIWFGPAYFIWSFQLTLYRRSNMQMQCNATSRTWTPKLTSKGVVSTVLLSYELMKRRWQSKYLRRIICNPVHHITVTFACNFSVSLLLNSRHRTRARILSLLTNLKRGEVRVLQVSGNILPNGKD